MRKAQIKFGKVLLIFAVMALAVLAGCSRDPQVRKKAYLDKGVAYFEKGKYDAAIIEYQNAIQIDPNFAAAHYEMARSFSKQGDWTHAFQELQLTVQLDPKNFKAQLDLADFYLAGRKFQDAHDHAALVLQSDPKNAQAQVILSKADAALGDSQKALSEAQQAVQIDPNRSLSYLNLALMYERSSDVTSRRTKLLEGCLTGSQVRSRTDCVGKFLSAAKALGGCGKGISSRHRFGSPESVSPCGSGKSLSRTRKQVRGRTNHAASQECAEG